MMRPETQKNTRKIEMMRMNTFDAAFARHCTVNYYQKKSKKLKIEKSCCPINM